MDSIVKNHGEKEKYKRHFIKDEIIVDMFVHVFVSEREKGRASLYKLRQTWTPLFHNELLLSLDKKTKAIDNAWPIQAKQPSGKNTILVNPNFINKDKKQPKDDSDSDEEMQKMAEEIERLKREKREIRKKKMREELEKQKREIAEVSCQYFSI